MSLGAGPDGSACANFALLTYALTVAKSGTGVGTVGSRPAGISCGTTCSATRNHGTTITLNPVPAAGSAFAGWSGACSGTARTCVVTMSEPRAVGASFVLP